jgi:uncharacterized protein YcsI (UPF0317 family)
VRRSMLRRKQLLINRVHTRHINIGYDCNIFRTNIQYIPYGHIRFAYDVADILRSATWWPK